MSYIGNQPTYAAFVTDQFSGNGGTTFTMSVAPANTASVLVAVSGVLQDPSTYSVVGTTLTFSQAPPVATANISVRYMGIPASGVTNTAYRTVTEFTSTNAQTIFNVPSYTVGFINVYLNGVRLGASDFTASNGTSVTLTAGAPTGALVTTESFYVSSVLNAIPATAGAVNTTSITDGAVTTIKHADASVTQAKLAANVAGNGPAFRAYSANNQTISTNVITKINYNTESVDTGSFYDPSLARFQPTVSGYYWVSASVQLDGTAGRNVYFNIAINKNGSNTLRTQFSYVVGTGTSTGISTSGLVYLNGTDYVDAQVYLYDYTATGTVLAIASSIDTVFQGYLARAA